MIIYAAEFHAFQLVPLTQLLEKKSHLQSTVLRTPSVMALKAKRMDGAVGRILTEPMQPVLFVCLGFV